MAIVDGELSLQEGFKVDLYQLSLSGQWERRLVCALANLAGADAITMAITTNNGNIFKNSTGSTVLTAHVYKAGAEVTGSALTALGSIKWYKDGGSTAVGTGATLTVNASDVSSKAVYTAQLEVS